MLSRRSRILVISETLANEVFGFGGEGLGYLRNLLVLELLKQLTDLVDTVPWMPRRGQLYESATERPDVTASTNRLVSEALRSHPENTTFHLSGNDS